MDSVNKTLYIPLRGKAFVSRKGLFLLDETAERIWQEEGFDLKGKSKSKWLAYYMGIRSAVFDRWLTGKMEENPGAAVLHIGCGLDSRVLRVGTRGHKWYDLDFPEVIRERQRYFSETDDYRMIAADVRENAWPDSIAESTAAIVVMEGVSMYLTGEERSALLALLAGRFEKVWLLMDCYSTMAAKLSRYKNPINDVGVTEVFGMDDPHCLEAGDFFFVKEHDMTPEAYIHQLQGMQRRIFRRLYAGNFAKKLYRLFEYRKG